MSNQISRLQLLSYGLVALPIAFAGFPLYVLAPDFYASNYGISLSLLGGLLLFIRFFDGVQDPLFGWLADGLRGKSRLCMGISGIALCLSIYALFNLSPLPPAYWFVICMMVCIGAYGLMIILLGTQAILWTTNSHEQTRIATAREGFGLIGLVIAVSMPSLLTHFVPENQVYVWYSTILAVFMAVGLIAFFRLPKSDAPTSLLAQNISPFKAFNALPKESRRLLLVHGLSMLASSAPATLVIFFVRDLLNAEALTGLFLLLYFLSGALAMPLWTRLSRHFGKPRTWAVSNLMATLGFIGAFFLGEGDTVWYGVICVVSGLALGADLTLPPSMLSDNIHTHSDDRFSGMHYAFLSFVGKISLALSSAITLPLIEMAGFVPDKENSADALLALSISYALIPCALKALAAGLLYCHFIQSHTGGHHENSNHHSNIRSSHHV